MLNDKVDIKGLKFTIKFTFIVFLIFYSASLSADLIVSLSEKSISDDPVSQLSAVAAQNFDSGRDRSREIVLGFVGDIMLDRGVRNSIYRYKNGDFTLIFDQVRSELSSTDILFGNLEGPVSDKGNDLGGLYSFRIDPAAIEGLISAGFDVLSFSNNHAGDWGEEALRDTIRRLRAVGIEVVGAGLSSEDTYQPVIFDIDSTKIAFLSFTENGGMYNGSLVATAREGYVKNSIQTTKSSGRADFIVTHFHFGEEYKREPNETQRRLARLAIDSGADLVIGTHPHVTQTIEKYRDRFIIYSLGNFIFDQNFSEETMSGWFLKAYLKKLQITDIEICDTRLNRLFQPTVFSCTSIFD